jgi:cytochrome c-type biogenesis protein CcsB
MIHVIQQLFSMKIAVLLLFLFGIIAGTATFVENDYGTQTAQALVYKAKWFELFLLYFVMILLYNIAKFKSYKTKPAVFLFHFSFLVVALGALTTRYIGYEGMMHIREGEESNTMLSSTKFLQWQVTSQTSHESLFDQKEIFLSSMTKNHLKEHLHIDGKEVTLELLNYLPTFQKSVVVDENGKAILELMVSEGSQGKPLFLVEGEVKSLRDFDIAFNSTHQKRDHRPTFHIRGTSNNLQVTFSKPLEYFHMDDKRSGKLEAGSNPFNQRTLYGVGNSAIVLKSAYEKAKVTLQATSLKSQAGQPELLTFQVSVGDDKRIVQVTPVSGRVGKIHHVTLGGVEVEVRVGAAIIPLPFAIALKEFQLERYPGSQTPSSYASEVVLLDREQNLTQPYRIYMNHVLDHRGYRFFQSSYDKDEKGTILSVNHDPGTLPTYIGYGVMILGMLWVLLSPNGRFQMLLKRTQKLQKPLMVALLFATLFLPQTTYAVAPTIEEEKLKTIQAYNKTHAEAFGALVLQDYQGRMKPLDTMAREVVAKVTGKSSVFGVNANQLFLGMMAQPELFQKVAFISLGGKTHVKISEMLGLAKGSRYAKFTDFFDAEGNYKLYNFVGEASRKRPLDKSVLDKELINLDERVNVSHMVYSGKLLRIFPKPHDANNKWLSPGEAIEQFGKDEGEKVKLGITAYFYTVNAALQNGNWELATKALIGLKQYQSKYGDAVLLTPEDVAWEMRYNRMGLFAKLVPFYIVLGLILLVGAFIEVLKARSTWNRFKKVTLVVLGLGFMVHLFGLGLRWYVSGHAPWSNAYEALVFIALSTVFAGLLLARKSLFTLGAATLLGGITLGVAHLSFINPEITNLVPVLKSYWLMIHVATIISGDGFLGLGSMLSLLVLILYIIAKKGNEQMKQSMKELTYLSEMSLIIGLFLMTIGNFLGGIWANESWGRYWGWDPKETWAAVTILIYATVLHLRFVPALKGNYTYHVASLWAYSTVIMTYFGVNYYLSGLHSYAAGDPVPIPSWVYYAVATLLVITLLAWRKRDYLEKEH